ncbi:MAG: ImmA/IrrE family metallo-endopeptidase [Candidatus Accumulibacter propinquus]|jgi:HTH-type transcriptional regulator/antitoxin HigA
MTAMHSFKPKWASPPGATILDLLKERGLQVTDLAQVTHRDVNSVTRLLFGVEPLTYEWAEGLSQALGASPTFWLRREEHYRSDLKRLTKETIVNKAETWVGDLPLRDMVQFGWIAQGSSSNETKLNACAFFGVTTGKAFQRKFQMLLSGSAYRTSPTFAPRLSAVAAWLRQGEIAAAAVDCAPWSESTLRSSLGFIRKLTRERDPSLFLPQLTSILASCGVAVVIAKAPTGCRASGATRFLSPQKALIQLSFRYLADDQFWFTVFHELGHLILHTHEELFLEGVDERNTEAEVEADVFATNTLFSVVGAEALERVRISLYDIVRLARKAGIAPGIVVGQLQQRKRVPFNHFNNIKARYTWRD